jgi:hypothetical protein
VTHITLGQQTGSHSLNVATNTAILADTFATRPDVLYVREPDRVGAFATGYAWEEGRWRGSWTAAGAEVKTTKHGVYFAQWQPWGSDDAWLLKADVYIIAAPSEGDTLGSLVGGPKAILKSRA